VNENIVRHYGNITLKNREELLHQRGTVLWFTGLSGSGKSTLAYALEERLIQKKHLSYVLDGDNIRHGLNVDLGFTPEARHENIRRVAEVTSLFANAGLITIVSFISPFLKDREMAKKIVGEARFFEVFIDVPIAECEQRDPKGLYKKARMNKIPNFTGISSPYERPVSPALTIKNVNMKVEEGVDLICKFLMDENILF